MMRKDLNYLNTNCRMYDMHFTETEFMNQTTYLEWYSNYFLMYQIHRILP
ncbi:hypothetical protein LSH36_43g03030, partial [Paralvinella palmiformis]